MPAVRKVVVSIEDIHMEAGRVLARSGRKVVAAAVISNPFAGRYVEDLQELVDAGGILGELLADRAVEALGEGRSAESYGKAAIVGCRGEIEHGAALLHPRMGKPVRAAIGQGLAIIPSATKRAAPGASIDVPLHFKDDEWSFDHFDAATFSIVDAPADDEIVLLLALSDRGRPLARVKKI